MRVLVATPYYSPVVGGLENYARSVNVALRDLGHEVIVVTSGSERRLTQDGVDGLTVHRLPAGIRVSNTPFHPLWLPQLRRIVRSERPDVILTHTPVPTVADLVARAAGDVPLVVTYHNDLTKDAGLAAAVVAAHWRLVGWGTLERADRVITTSRRYLETSRRLDAVRARVAVVPPGVDPARFRPDVDPSPVRRRFTEKQLLLFVSSLHRSHAHKGLGMLLQSLRDLRAAGADVRLLVVGRGDGLEDYRAQAHRLGVGDQVTFTGFVPDEDLPTYYAAADAFVLPSTNMSEGFGMVLLEAAACGTPVVGTDVGGIPAALETVGSPYLARPDVASLTEVLTRALAAPRQAAGTRAPTSWLEVGRLTEAVLDDARRARVAVVHNVVAPYRLDLFDELSRHVNLQVFFTQGAGRGRLWDDSTSGHGFDARRLPALAVGPVVFNPGGWRRLRRSRFDVLVTNTDPDTAPLSLSGLLLARLRRKPVVVWSEVTDDVVWSFPSLATATHGGRAAAARALREAVNAYRDLFFGRARSFVAFSDAARAFLVRRGVAEQRVVRTHQVVPAGQLPAPGAVTRTGKTFLYLGYLELRKNVDLLLDAFARLDDPDARLMIAGAGPVEAALRERSATDARVVFRGYVDGQEKADLYGSCDVLVLPTRHDCWGLVVNEAIHYGLAVIVSDAAAARELVTASRGLVVPRDDVDALTEAMRSLLESPDTLAAMQAANRGLPEVSDVTGAAESFLTAVRMARA